MNKVTTILMLSAVLMFVAGPAAADWFPGDGHKMHYPQLPDPFGWDVAFQPYGGSTPLADDWECTQTGPVDDIHFWVSWEYDEIGYIDHIVASIYSNNPMGPNGWSEPEDLLWRQGFGGPEVNVIPYGDGQQGWYDPCTGFVNYPDHFQYFQVNIVDILDPFVQEEGDIYWLALEVFTEFGNVGWKTSQDHFMDDAVFKCQDTGVWVELRDPFTGESLDLAFVITPEPGTMSLLVLGGIGVLMRRRRK